MRPRPRRRTDDGQPVFTRSPLLNGATPFTQKLLIYEELGAQALPASLRHRASCPCPPCERRRAAPRSTNFLKKPLLPAPREEANVQAQNPWLAKVNECLGLGLAKSPIEGRPPGQYFAHQRYQQFYPEAYVQTAIAGARVNTGMRDSQQLHGFAAGTEFGPGGLYYNPAAGPTKRHQAPAAPQAPGPERQFGVDL